MMLQISVKTGETTGEGMLNDLDKTTFCKMTKLCQMINWFILYLPIIRSDTLMKFI